MARILVNDGINAVGEQLLRDAGHELEIKKVEQQDLYTTLPDFDAICIRSATKVRQDLIDVCPGLKAIARGGVGLDNVDVEHALSKGIHVINTPGASSRSVAELTFAHILSIARSLYKSNREMPIRGAEDFGSLKKSFGGGLELYDRTIGIMGFGMIGQEVAKMAIGLGMNVLAVDPFVDKATISIGSPSSSFNVDIETVSKDIMLPQADIVTLHLPFLGEPVLGSSEFDKMKDGSIVINCARGGTVDEDALISALKSGKVAAAGLDCFENEPQPRPELLKMTNVSLTPHIGAATKAAQSKIGVELAEKLNAALS